jgi:hypothetical protein
MQPTAWDGVYDQPWGGQRVRVIVLNEITPHPRNAAWELFANERERLRQGLIHYRARHPHPTPGGHWELLHYLHRLYQREVPDMAYTYEEFLREAEEIAISRAIERDPEAILNRFDPEDVLKRFDQSASRAWIQPSSKPGWLSNGGITERTNRDGPHNGLSARPDPD